MLASSSQRIAMMLPRSSASHLTRVSGLFRFTCRSPYLASLEWAAANRGFLAERNAWLLAHPVPPHARQLHYQASEGHDAWDQLPQITAPTLLIHGSDDEMNVVANARLLAERIPGAELHIIPGARHVYYWDHSEEANRVVRAFLERHPLPR